MIARLLPLLLAGGLAQAGPVIDDSGADVALEPPARRIVTLSPHATELAIAAGAGPYLVAAAAGDIPLPPGVLPLPSYGGIDRERLLALSPDLVIGWSSGNRGSDLAWLRAQQVRLYESEPANLAAIADNLRDIGRLAGTSDTAARAAEAFSDAVHSACAQRHNDRVVYVSVWERPALSLGGRHWLNDVLRHARLRNLYGNIDKAVFPIEAEARMAAGPTPQLSLGPDNPLGDLLSRPGPRLVEALAALCHEDTPQTPRINP